MRRGKCVQVWEGDVLLCVEFQEGNKFMRARSQQRVCWEIIPGSIHDRKHERFQPCCSTFWKGDQENIFIPCLEAFLHPHDSFYSTPRIVPKALVLVHKTLNFPAFFSWEGGNDLSFASTFPLFLIFIGCWWQHHGILKRASHEHKICKHWATEFNGDF